MMPLAGFLLLVIWRMARRWKRVGTGVWGDALAAGGLFLCCWPVAAWLMIASLEKQFPVQAFPAGDAQAIVVLAANFFPASGAHTEDEPGFGTYIRTAHAAWLFHHWRRLPIVASGGSAGQGMQPVAAVMRRELLERGVPDEMIWVEGRSSNTYGNAVETAHLLMPKGMRRIVLVTEAFHMPRAVGCFRKQGFEVLPAAASYRTLQLHSWGEFLLPRVWAVEVEQEAIHEWVGLAWYKIHGEI